MNQKFKIKRLMRFIALLGLTVFCFTFGEYIYEIYKGMPKEKDFTDLLVQLLLGLLFVYCAIAFNKEEYEIRNKTIVIRSFLAKERSIRLSEIQRLEQINSWPFTYIKLFFRNGRKKNILPLDNQKDFIQIVNDMLRENESTERKRKVGRG